MAAGVAPAAAAAAAEAEEEEEVAVADYCTARGRDERTHTPIKYYGSQRNPVLRGGVSAAPTADSIARAPPQWKMGRL